jgi:hypothetical protein
MAAVGALKWGRSLFAAWGARRGAGGGHDADRWDDDKPLTHSRTFTPVERQFFAAGDGDADLIDQGPPVVPAVQASPRAVPRPSPRRWVRRVPLVLAFSGFALVGAGVLGVAGGGSAGGDRGAAGTPAAAVITGAGARKASVRKAKRRRGAVPRHTARTGESVTGSQKATRTDRSGRQGAAQVIHSPTRR